MAKCCDKSTMVNPYNRADYERLKQAQRQLTDLLPVLDKVESCGVECDAFRQVGGELMARLQAIEKEFMTPTPKR